MARIQQQEYDIPDVYKDMVDSVTTVPGKAVYTRAASQTVKEDNSKNSSTVYRGGGGPF